MDVTLESMLQVRAVLAVKGITVMVGGNIMADWCIRQTVDLAFVSAGILYITIIHRNV